MVQVNPNDSTLYLEWGGDLVVSQNGGLVLAYGWDQVKQRILRRLLTNPNFTLADGTKVPADYIFDSNYGLGFRRRIGEPFYESLRREMEALIYNAVIVDEGVDTLRPPTIELTEKDHRVYVDIIVYLRVGRPGRIAFNFAE